MSFSTVPPKRGGQMQANCHVIASTARADAPLKSALELDAGQAQQVAEIEGDYRKAFRGPRGEHARLSRALRRARKANDAAEVARLEPEVAALQGELADIRSNTDERINALLTTAQKDKFAAYIERRQAMVGSSRDARLTK